MTGSVTARTHASSRASARPTSSRAAGALEPFASYYPAAKKIPRVPKGQTLDTFDEAQVQALHRAYWSAPPGASLPEMIKLAVKDPAFLKRREAVEERQVGRLFAKLPESFPWGWRSRALAATSHVFVDALASAPEGSAVSKLAEDLAKKIPGFPTHSAFKHAASGAWVDEPDRFPFVKALEKTGGGYVLEARGAAPAVRKDHQDRWVLNEDLAKKVKALAKHPDVRWDWSFEQWVELVNKELGGGFTKSTFNLLRERFDVPSYPEIRAGTLKKLCETIDELYNKENIRDAKSMMVALHEKHGYPLWTRSQLTYFRSFYPKLVPDFRAERDDGALDEARQLLDAIKANPDLSYSEVGETLGYNARRSHGLVTLIHKHMPGELPKRDKAPDYTLADRRILEAAGKDAPLGATCEDMLRVLRTESPEFLEKHPFASAESFYVSLRRVLEIDSWRLHQQQRYAEAFAKVAESSPRGTTLSALINQVSAENPGAYSFRHAVRMADQWKEQPKLFPWIAKLRDSTGKFPWEVSKVRYTEALAKRVAAMIEAHPGSSIPQIVGRLRGDKEFSRDYPTFNVEHVHRLRLAFPKIVPYIDDLKVRGTAERRKAFHKALDQIAKKAAKVADSVDDQSGMTVAYIARQLGIKQHRVLSAIHRAPHLFPWYRERPAGEVDLYLATRVAHEMEHAPLGTELQDIIKKLKGDSSFREKYPAFNYHTFNRLREQYPDLVPHWFNRNKVLRSKILVDALVTAKKGASLESVVKSLEEIFPGQFEGSYKKPYELLSMWEAQPELFPFTKALAGPGGKIRLEGRGEKLKPAAETNDEIATRLAKLERITERLPLLDRLSEGMSKTTFEDYEMIAIQHLLGPQVALFESMKKLGMSPNRSTIIGIPYSVSQPVAETLEDKGWDVRVPPLDLETWYAEVKRVMEERIKSAEKSGKKIIVVDDGGLVAMMLDKYPELQKKAHLFKIVEQTTRGITVADGANLRAPVVNVAQSWGKYVEGPMIGDIVAQKLLGRLAAINIDEKDLKGKHVGICGLGTIGEPLAVYLAERGAKITVLDPGEAAQKRAKELGFAVAGDRKKFFGSQEMIIGASGHRSITAEDLENLKDGCVLGSCSSKLVEIDVEALANGSKGKKPEVIDSTTFPPTVRYTLKNGKTVDLLARGFPLNFDGDVENVESEKIQLTMGLLLIGAIQAGNAGASGVQPLDPKQQLHLLSQFEEVGGVHVSGKDVSEALKKAQEMLKEMRKKGSAADRRHIR